MICDNRGMRRPAPSSSSFCPPLCVMAQPSVSLVNEDLWREFHAQTTEMVVTKNGRSVRVSGDTCRKMFPKLEYRLSGLEPHSSYALLLSFERADDFRFLLLPSCSFSFRHKFVQGEWRPLGRAEPQPPPMPVHHPDLVASGLCWMRAPVNFDRVKITNNPLKASSSNVRLSSSFSSSQPRSPVNPSVL